MMTQHRLLLIIHLNISQTIANAAFSTPFMHSSTPAGSLYRHKSTAASPPQNDQLRFDTAGRDAYNVSRTFEGPDACAKVGIDKKLGISSVKTIYRNLTYPQLFDHEQANNEGVVAQAEYGPTFTVDTGKYTGRSPKDRWIVLNPGSETAEHIDWNNINMATTPEVYDELYNKAVAHFNTRDTAYVFDGYCGANLNTRKKIRFVHEMAWQQHFGTFALCRIPCCASGNFLFWFVGSHPNVLSLFKISLQSPICSFVPKRRKNWRTLNRISPLSIVAVRSMTTGNVMV